MLTVRCGGAEIQAFVYAESHLAREHILCAAAWQYIEGDVQHWWHPHSGRGVRTRIWDDLAWLPYVVDRYVHVTGDGSVVDAYVSFLAMRSLEQHESEVYDMLQVTDEHASIYEHFRHALERAYTSADMGCPSSALGTGMME